MGKTSSVIAWFLLMPTIYILSEVIVPRLLHNTKIKRNAIFPLIKTATKEYLNQSYVRYQTFLRKSIIKGTPKAVNKDLKSSIDHDILINRSREESVLDSANELTPKAITINEDLKSSIDDDIVINRSKEEPVLNSANELIHNHRNCCLQESSNNTIFNFVRKYPSIKVKEDYINPTNLTVFNFMNQRLSENTINESDTVETIMKTESLDCQDDNSTIFSFHRILVGRNNFLGCKANDQKSIIDVCNSDIKSNNYEAIEINVDDNKNILKEFKAEDDIKLLQENESKNQQASTRSFSTISTSINSEISSKFSLGSIKFSSGSDTNSSKNTFIVSSDPSIEFHSGIIRIPSTEDNDEISDFENRSSNFRSNSDLLAEFEINFKSPESRSTNSVNDIYSDREISGDEFFRTRNYYSDYSEEIGNNYFEEYESVTSDDSYVVNRLFGNFNNERYSSDRSDLAYQSSSRENSNNSLSSNTNITLSSGESWVFSNDSYVSSLSRSTDSYNASLLDLLTEDEKSSDASYFTDIDSYLSSSSGTEKKVEQEVKSVNPPLQEVKKRIGLKLVKSVFRYLLTNLLTSLSVDIWLTKLNEMWIRLLSEGFNINHDFEVTYQSLLNTKVSRGRRVMNRKVDQLSLAESINQFKVEREKSSISLLAKSMIKKKDQLVTALIAFDDQKSGKNSKLDDLWVRMQDANLPNYFTLCMMVQNELYINLMDCGCKLEKFKFQVKVFCYILSFSGVGHLFSRKGLDCWYRVMGKFFIFFMACLGIWTEEAAQAYDLDGIREAMCFREDDLAYTNIIRAVVGVRALLFQAFPVMSILSVAIIILCGSPLFVFGAKMNRRLPSLIILNPFEIAQEREERLRNKDFTVEENRQYWIVYLRTLQVFFIESRFLSFINNGALISLSIILLYESGTSLTAYFILMGIIIFYNSLNSFSAIIFIGEVLSIDDSYFSFRKRYITYLYIFDLFSIVFTEQRFYPRIMTMIAKSLIVTTIAQIVTVYRK